MEVNSSQKKTNWYKKGNSNKSSAPFFPPGIAIHKNVSNTHNLKRQIPPTVKEMKKLTVPQMSKSLNRSFTISNGGLHLSNSSPNLHNSILPKHNCDMGLIVNNEFKATPLPDYYSTESLKRNKMLWEMSKSQSKSYDHLHYHNQKANINKLECQKHDKPFYPPSKYPSIYDENCYIKRLLETREKYKTPNSRKVTHQLAMDNPIKRENKNVIKKTSSVPNLSRKEKKITTKSPTSDCLRKGTQKQIQNKKPDKGRGKGGVRKEENLMMNSFFYPKPTVDDFFHETDDLMARSLLNESTLADKIYSGTLERAAASNYMDSNDNNNCNRLEVTDLEDNSPSKSFDNRRHNSISMDSLDGRRHKQDKEQEEKMNQKGIDSKGKENLSSVVAARNHTNSSISSDIDLNDIEIQYDGEMVMDDKVNGKVQSNNDNDYSNSHMFVGNKDIFSSYRDPINYNDKRQFNTNAVNSTNWDQYNSDKLLESQKPLSIEVKPSELNQQEPFSIKSTHTPKGHMMNMLTSNYIFDFAHGLATTDLNNTTKKNNNRYIQSHNGKVNGAEKMPVNNSYGKDLLNVEDSENTESQNSPATVAEKSESISDTSEGSWSDDSILDTDGWPANGLCTVSDCNIGSGKGDNNQDYYSLQRNYTKSQDLSTRAYSDIGNSLPSTNKWNRYKRRLQSENPLKPLCNRCHKPAYFNERISISNLIFHRSCFKCRRCDTHLSFNNCILHRRKLYCEVHIQSKVFKRLTTVPIPEGKQFSYEGIRSVKQKLESVKTTTSHRSAVEPKRITPPREGVTTGVLESTPKERDPNVVVAGEAVPSRTEELDRLVNQSGNTSRDYIARFKQMEQRGGSVNGEDGQRRQSDVVGVDTKSLRNRFIAGGSENKSEKQRKINPSEEIQELYKKENSIIFENDPEVRSDTIKSDQQKDASESVSISRSRAKELKERFSNYSSNVSTNKREFKLELGEGGVYESVPHERDDDIIPYQYEKKVDIPSDSVKSNLQKFKEMQSQNYDLYQKRKSEPIKLDLDLNKGGVFESCPRQSEADSTATSGISNYREEFKDKKYANEAKLAFLEKQKQQEMDCSIKKSPPKMINIWQDLCSYSGVFENQPKEQNSAVVKSSSMKSEKSVEQSDKPETTPA